MKDHPLYKAIVELSDCDDRKKVEEARKAIVKYLTRVIPPVHRYGVCSKEYWMIKEIVKGKIDNTQFKYRR